MSLFQHNGLPVEMTSKTSQFVTFENPVSTTNKVHLFPCFQTHPKSTLAPTIPPSTIPPSLPLWVHLSIHLPVLATRSHLVAQQHDDHVLLGVLMDLCQPSLETERQHRMVKESKTVQERRESREYRGGRHDREEGLEIDSGDRGDGWIHRETGRERDKRLIYSSLAAVHLVFPSSLRSPQSI